jgi:hypothetical protein
MISMLTCLVACGNHNSSPQSAQAVSCRGIYYTTSASGNLQKWNQFYQADQDDCLTDELQLSNWESSNQAWTKNHVTCVPQTAIQSQSLVANGNFYSYRDQKIYLDLNVATGVFRRIVYGEAQDGSPLFTRLQGCFYVRNDATNGNQLLLDTAVTATSEAFDPSEIFLFTQTESGLNLVRYDESSDWDWSFCPYLTAPTGFCDLLRNANLLYLPSSLSSVQQATLLQDAILIRKTYNYGFFTGFDSLWSEISTSRTESTRDDFRYAVIQDVDSPQFTSTGWRDYVMNQPDAVMPDTSSSLTPDVCYNGFQTVTLSSRNTARISGEICYVNGVYQFTSTQ